MKKLLSLALSLVLVLSLAGCSSGKDAKTIYDEVVKKNQELTSMDMTSKMTMQMKQGDQTIDITMDMNAKMDGINTESMKYVADTTTSMMGQNVEMTAFYTDGYYYLESMGQKMKYPMELEKLMEQVQSSASAMDSSSLKSVSVKKDGENQILTYTSDPEKMDSYIQEVMKSLGGAVPGMDSMEIKITEASGTMTVNKDGYYTSMTTKVVMDMSMAGETVTITANMDATVQNPGQPVEVTIPSTDGYTEIDPAALGM